MCSMYKDHQYITHTHADMSGVHVEWTLAAPSHMHVSQHRRYYYPGSVSHFVQISTSLYFTLLYFSILPSILL